MGRAGQNAADEWELEELEQQQATLAAADQLAWTLDGMNKQLRVEAATQSEEGYWNVALQHGDVVVLVRKVWGTMRGQPYKKRVLEALVREASYAVSGFDNYCLRFDVSGQKAKVEFLKCQAALQDLRQLFGSMADDVATDYSLYWKELAW
jgi:hypothetical protein